VPTYQTNVRLPFETVLRTEFCEIYRYRPYPQRAPEGECPLCNPDSETSLVSESARSVAIIAPNPATRGHTLVLPKRHVADYFNLVEREQKACWLLLNRVQTLLKKHLDPENITVGFNLEHLDREVEHAHLHILPQ
jgi:diadenosine tetraphosphate (Ap4A) HIT family hydrolase